MSSPFIRAKGMPSTPRTAGALPSSPSCQTIHTHHAPPPSSPHEPLPIPQPVWLLTAPGHSQRNVHPQACPRGVTPQSRPALRCPRGPIRVRVNHEALWQTLLHRGVPMGLVDRITSMCTGATACARVGGARSSPFPIKSGVHQGCPMSPLLFNFFIDTVIRSLLATLPDGCGVSVGHTGQPLAPSSPPLRAGGLILHLLLCADDVVVLATSIEALTHMLTHLNASCEDFGLDIYFINTEVQGLGCPPGQQPPTSNQQPPRSLTSPIS
eukprot:364857-Chlamydomonas_euryale.AAC.4